MSTTAQLNIRVSSQLKNKAHKAAESKGLKLNAILNQFLQSFVKNPDVVQISQSFDMEQIFDKGFTDALASSKTRKTLKKINNLL
ncbi:hypothetical protein KBC03_05915 [Patescibacteria group bacterium]|nr:hypothetical protein [Patescibacteria group bacterium]